ncbi:hypothetical protein PSHT_15164 [Puccinia striiformis]|uniref:Uncharacterized protein n=1 Tax=Puccinia striiformis TaxID=27350 RepID=A0A2S4UGH4_9BASI|nr:hypothetical protein PSHT_15164 [Puccinia striiformis]
MTDSPGNTTSNIPHLPSEQWSSWEAAEANVTPIGRLEDLILALAVKSEEPPHCTRLGDNELDLQTALSPLNVTRASDKIKIIGGLINDSNLLKFYANKVLDNLTGYWEAFKTRMFQVALPLNWWAYSARARTLQTLANFDAAEIVKITDSDLAQFIIFGLAQDLQDRVAKHQIMEKNLFEYSYFETTSQRLGYHRKERPNSSLSPLNLVNKQRQFHLACSHLA